jgi:ankyrin repeat protein
MQMLIKHKADLHIPHKSNTCLILASLNGHLAVVHVILSEVRFRGDKSYLSAQNEEGETCLHAACQEGHSAIAIALLDMGTDTRPDLRVS